MYMYIYTLSSDFALFVPIRVPQDPLILRINFALPSSPKTQITNSSYVVSVSSGRIGKPQLLTVFHQERVLFEPN